MNLLAIETATENCSVAICRGGETATLSEILPNGHSKRIHAMVRELTEKCHLTLQQLDGIVVDTGPGSFTGLRIGIGIAQGLAYGSGVKTMGISSLAALAVACSTGYVVSAIDARMGQVYWNVFETQGTVRPLGQARVSNPEVVAGGLERLISLEQMASPNRQQWMAAGSGWQVYSSAMPATIYGSEIHRSPVLYPSAENLLILARRQGVDALDAPALLAATYVRDDVAKKSSPKIL